MTGIWPQLVTKAARALGVEAIVRHTYARRRAGIVVYHDPTPERLESHLEFLRTRYTFMSLTELIDALRQPEWAIASPSVVITFDDGHLGNARLGRLLDRYGVRPTIYLCTQIVTGEGTFWFKVPGVDPEPLKSMTPSERSLALERATGRSRSNRPRDALTAKDVASLAPVIDFGSHTSTHPILPLCDDRHAQEEIVMSRAEVESLSGRPCLHFSYPNGDFGPRELALVREAGYRSARTTQIGWVGPKSDPFTLPIVSLADHATVDMLAGHLAGLLAIKRHRPARRRRRELGRLGQMDQRRTETASASRTSWQASVGPSSAVRGEN